MLYTWLPQEFFTYVDKRKTDFHGCFSKELLTYLYRRTLTAEDKCAVQAVAKRFDDGAGVKTVLTEILSWSKK